MTAKCKIPPVSEVSGLPVLDWGIWGRRDCSALFSHCPQPLLGIQDITLGNILKLQMTTSGILDNFWLKWTSM